MFSVFNVNDACALAAAAMVSVSGSAMALGMDPDGDVDVQTTGWVSSGDVDVVGMMGLQQETADGVRGGAGVDAMFVMTGSDPEGDSASDVAYTPDGSRFVIANRESRNLIIRDASTLAFIGEVSISGAAQAMAITPDGLKAVVANIDNNTVSIVDLVAMTEIAVIPVGVNPGIVAISPAGDVAAVGIGFESEIAVIDIASASIVRTISGIGYSLTMSFSSEAPATSLAYSRFLFLDNDRVINADQFADELQIIDVRTGVVVRTPLPDSPRGIAISGDQSRVAITHTSSTRSITVVDSASGMVINSIPTAENLWGTVTLNMDGTKGVVGIQNAARVVDLVTGSLGPSLNTASINELATTFDGRYAVGIGYRGAVIDMVSGGLVNQVNFAVSTEHGALSPIAYQVAMCSTTFGDDLVVADVEGAMGSLTSFGPIGPEIEGDRCRTVAVSPDGSRVVAVSIFSDNATVIDSVTGAKIGSAPLGQRPSAVAITPDGTRALVGNLDSSFATIVNLADATSTNVNISTRAGSVAIHPGGQYGYVGVVASGDGVWRIDLNTNSVSGGKIPTGNMGGTGYSFNQSSGITISHDGARLAVAGTYSDVVSVIDTASWSMLANLPSGDFPTTIAFSADDSLMFSANRNDNSVTVYDNSGGVPVFLRTIAVGASPWHLTDDGQGRLWVNNWGDSSVGVYDTATGALVNSFAFADRAVGLGYDAASDSIRVAHGTVSITLGGDIGFSQSQSGVLTVIDTHSFAMTDSVLGVGPSAMGSSADGSVLAFAAPIGDGVAILSLSAGCSSADLAEPFGVLNFFDVSAFLSAFSSQDPLADFTGEGVFDFFDVSAFLGVFGAGCP